MFTALQATSLTLITFLEQSFRQDAKLRSFFDPAAGGTMIVSLNSPQEMTELNDQGLSVWLYQVVRDPENLNMLPERIGFDQYRREPLPVRLHYMMTPLVSAKTKSSPETEQMILGKILQVFHDRPKMRGVDLQGDLTGTDAEFTIRLENLSLEQISQVFYSLDRSLQLSVSYEVSIVYIESEREPEEAQPVQVFAPRYGIEINGSAP